MKKKGSPNICRESKTDELAVFVRCMQQCWLRTRDLHRPLKIVEDLLHCGADPNGELSPGLSIFTYLFSLTREQNDATFGVLIKLTVKLFLIYGASFTPGIVTLIAIQDFFWAEIPIMRTLIDCGADPLTCCPDTGMCAVEAMIQCRKERELDMMMEWLPKEWIIENLKQIDGILRRHAFDFFYRADDPTSSVMFKSLKEEINVIKARSLVKKLKSVLRCQFFVTLRILKMAFEIPRNRSLFE